VRDRQSKEDLPSLWTDTIQSVKDQIAHTHKNKSKISLLSLSLSLSLSSELGHFPPLPLDLRILGSLALALTPAITYAL
jgi:hypothetical protein